MKQLKTAATLSVLFAILVLACKKGGDNNEIPVDKFKNLRVKTIAGVDGGVTEGYFSTYTYDNSGNITKEEDNNGITEYIYSSGKLIRKVTQGASVDIFEYELNAEGYVRSNRKLGEPAVYIQEYSGAGFITRSYDNQTPQYEARYYYNVVTGLLDSMRSTIGGIWNSTATYEFYTDKLNTLANKNFGQFFYGDNMPRPIKRNTYRYVDNGVEKTQVSENVFVFDNEGKITRKTFTNDGQIYTYDYTYY